MRRLAMALGLFTGMLAGAAGASDLAVGQSPRPEVRPAVARVAVAQSPRPEPRPAVTRADTETLQATPIPPANLAFQRWIAHFRPRALAHGVRAATFDRAFAQVRYDTEVIQRDRNQSEFTKTIWDYLDSAASPTRIANGRLMMRKYAHVLNQIQARYGVDKQIVVAIWGLESAYGAHRGHTPIIDALATLAFDGRRGAFFEGQLIDALKIVQDGDVTVRGMTGSWAGAMGHTQFIPSSYLTYAVDFRGDGKRDIWSDDPTDALASTAAYLAHFGWVKGQPWGIEVRLPHGFNYALAGVHVQKPVSAWRALGLRTADGGRLPDHGRASVLLPAGAHGAAFLIFHNFHVLEHYNSADAYVIGVGYLADRIMGGEPIQHSWPRGDRALTRSEREELQQRLTNAGFSTGGIDGRIGPDTIKAVRAYQRHAGLIPDGYASLRLLDRLRRS